MSHQATWILDTYNWPWYDEGVSIRALFQTIFLSIKDLNGVVLFGWLVLLNEPLDSLSFNLLQTWCLKRWLMIPTGKRFLILLPVFKKPPQKLVLRIRDFPDLIRNWIGRCFFFHQPHPRSGRVWSLTATFSWGMFGWNLDRKNETNATFSWKMWLFAVYRGWPTTRLDRDYFISHEIRIPILHQSEFHGSCHGRGFWSLLT